MIEHEDFHHEHRHEKGGPMALLPAAVLLGCLVIAGSILYGTGQIAKKLTNGSQAVRSPETGQNAAAPPAPGQPVDVAPRDDAPVLGDQNAPVTMVEFTDFQCPFCQSFFQNSYTDIKSKYVDTGKVKIIFRHYPLPFHANAKVAAEAAECANRQGKFVEYHDVLFKNSQADGTNLDAASLKKYAKDLGLNTGDFNSCLDNGDTTAVVQKDTADGNAAGVSGTPSFFINGVGLVGAQPIASFEQAIDAALNK